MLFFERKNLQKLAKNVTLTLPSTSGVLQKPLLNAISNFLKKHLKSHFSIFQKFIQKALL
jgi:hypothetical protein